MKVALLLVLCLSSMMYVKSDLTDLAWAAGELAIHGGACMVGPITCVAANVLIKRGLCMQNGAGSMCMTPTKKSLRTLKKRIANIEKAQRILDGEDTDLDEDDE